jgi:hypothetical protein
MYTGLQVKYRLFLSDKNEISNFRGTLSRNTQISNFMKIRPVAAELFQAAEWTDITKLNGRFSQFFKCAFKKRRTVISSIKIKYADDIVSCLRAHYKDPCQKFLTAGGGGGRAAEDKHNSTQL